MAEKGFLPLEKSEAGEELCNLTIKLKMVIAFIDSLTSFFSACDGLIRSEGFFPQRADHK